jgi:hypothetical protein
MTWVFSPLVLFGSAAVSDVHMKQQTNTCAKTTTHVLIPVPDGFVPRHARAFLALPAAPRDSRLCALSHWFAAARELVPARDGLVPDPGQLRHQEAASR